MSFTIRTHIDRPVAAVYDYLADSTNTPSWYEAVHTASALDDGPPSIGKRYRLERRLPGIDAVNIAEITELEPDAVVTITSVEGPTPFRYRYVLAPEAAGRTLLQLEGEISGEGLPGPAAVLAPLAERLFANGMRANLANLKRILEND